MLNSLGAISNRVYNRYQMKFPINLDYSASSARILLKCRNEHQVLDRLHTVPDDLLAIVFDVPDRRRKLCRLLINLRMDFTNYDISCIKDVYQVSKPNTSYLLARIIRIAILMISTRGLLVPFLIILTICLRLLLGSLVYVITSLILITVFLLVASEVVLHIYEGYLRRNKDVMGLVRLEQKLGNMIYSLCDMEDGITPQNVFEVNQYHNVQKLMELVD